jgi:hypothetical protein
LQKSDLARAGETANRAAANYLFANYRQRRALSHFDPETLAGLAEYAEAQQTPLPNSRVTFRKRS